MKQLIVLIFSIIIFASCRKEEYKNILNLSIENHSSSHITDMKVYVNSGISDGNFIDSLSVDNIDTGENQNVEWNLDDLPSVDGDFVISFSSNATIQKKEFGYFSNGKLLEKNYNIQIEDDAIKIIQ